MQCEEHSRRLRPHALLEELLSDQPTVSPGGPAHIIGIEQEFEFFENGSQRDFRRYIHDIVPRHGQGYFQTGPFAYHLDNGLLVLCDGWEAEIAAPPVRLRTGILSSLPGLTGHYQSALTGLIDRWSRRTCRTAHIRGFSTHFSAYCSTIDIDRLCAIYAQTMAPAMMMLTDLRTSPGLLVRPRNRRFEIGCEYVPPTDHLIAAATFFVAGFLAVWQAVLNRDLHEIPCWFDADRLERPQQRYGYYVDRAAFGSDLYGHGRKARLICRNGSRVSAQEVLRRCWAFARPTLCGVATEEEIELVTRFVEGRRKLPLELANPSVHLGKRSSAADSREPESSADFREGLRGAALGPYTIAPHIVTWDYIIFRIARGDRKFFANIPRRFLSAFHRLVREKSALTAFFDRVEAEGLDQFSLTDPNDAEAPGLFREVDIERLSSAPTSSVKKKKPPPGRKQEACTVTVLKPETAETPPIIEICVPATRDPLVVIKPQEPLLNAATEGLGVMLHSGALHLHELDLQVRSIGFPFQILRHYRSGIDYDGILGRGWEHIYNKRMVPTRPAEARTTDFGWCERYEGPEGPPSGDLTYYDGRGRRDHHTFLRWEHRTVRKCWGDDGRLRTFKAVVTTYSQNPGERWEIKRYAVYEGDAGWDDPIFYVLRTHDGTHLIFNCHGYIIAWQDRHRNTMRFRYGLPFNPQTGYLVLRVIRDTTQREHRLDYGIKAGALRIIRIQDAFQRSLRFIYNDRGELTDVLAPPGQHNENRRIYRYHGRVGLLAEAVAPEEAAQPQKPAYLHNRYDSQERIIEQRLGSPSGVQPQAGGTTRFEYHGPTVSAVIDRRNVRTEYDFQPLHHTFVLTRRSIQAQQPTIPGVRFQEPHQWTWRLTYDDQFRVRRLIKPRLGEERYRYERTGKPLRHVGDERDWVEAGLTWDDDLSRGNVMERMVISHRRRDGNRLHAWTWEPLYNQPLEIRTPLGVTRFSYDHGSCRTPEKNGVPTAVQRPTIVNPDGQTRAVREAMTYRQGGLVASHLDPDGVRTEYDYDDNGALAEVVIDPNGVALRTRYVNDPRGNPLVTIDAEGRQFRRDYDDRDNPILERDPTLHVRELFFDRQDRLVKVVEIIEDLPAPFRFPSEKTRPLEHTIAYDMLGQVVARTRDSRGLNLREEFEWDGEGNVLEHRLPRATGSNPEEPANRTRWAYDARGLRFSETAAPGSPDERTLYWLYDEDGNPRFHIRADRGVWSFLYNGFNELIQARNPIGVIEHNSRDAAGRVVRTRFFGPTGGPTPTNRRGRMNRLLMDVRFERDAEDRAYRRIASEFDIGESSSPAREVIETTTWSPGGRLERMTDGAHRQTSYAYDRAGRMIRVERPGGHFAEYTLSKTGQLLRERRVAKPEGTGITPAPAPLDLTIVRTYDPLDRLRSESHPGAGTVQYAYDSRGMTRAVLFPTGGLHVYRYDVAGRQVETIIDLDQAAGDVARLKTSYNRNGQPIIREDGEGRQTIYRYDAQDRLRQVTDADGRSTRVDYDAEGRPELFVARSGERLRTVFDLAGRPISRQHENPAGFRLEQAFEWDGLGRPTRVTDNNEGGVEVRMKWSALGRLRQEIQDGLTIDYDYDPSGQMTRIRYPSNHALDIEPTVSGKPGTIKRDGYELARYRYLGDRLDERSVSTTLHAPSGRVHFPLIKRFRYNNAGQIVHLSHSIHDSVTDPADPQDIVLYSVGRFRYDAAGRISEKRTRDFTERYTYDLANRLIHTVIDPSDRPGIRRAEVRYLYDRANNILERIEQRTPSRGRRQTSSIQRQYNALNALISQSVTSSAGGTETKPFGLDARGNLSSTPHTVPVATRDIEAERRLFYDALGRLRMVFLSTNEEAIGNFRITYRYDAWGRRIGRREERVRGPANTVVSSVDTRYVFWGERCIEEYESRQGAPSQLVRRYIHGIGSAELIALDVDEEYVGADIDNSGQAQGLTTLAFLDDQERSIVALARMRYVSDRFPVLFERVRTDAFGLTERFQFDNRGRPTPIRRSATEHGMGHHGRRMHEREGLYYTQRRFFDPSTGRFISRDDLGTWGDALSLGNAYAFAANNGIHYADDSGSIAVSAAVGIIALGAYWVSTYAIAEAARSDFAAAFSPGHQASVAWHGEQYFSGRPVDAVDRTLAGVDVALSLIPGGGFFGKGAVHAGRGLKTVAYFRMIDHATDAARVAHGMISTGYGIYMGFEHGSAGQIGLGLLSIALQAGHLRAWARSGRRRPYEPGKLDEIRARARNSGGEQIGPYMLEGSRAADRADGVFTYDLYFVGTRNVRRSPNFLAQLPEHIRVQVAGALDEASAAGATAARQSSRLQRLREFLGTVETPNRGLGLVARELEDRARSAQAHTLVINGYEIINPGFTNRGLVSFFAKQLGFDMYSFTLGGGEPAVQLVKRLS